MIALVPRVLTFLSNLQFISFTSGQALQRSLSLHLYIDYKLLGWKGFLFGFTAASRVPTKGLAQGRHRSIRWVNISYLQPTETEVGLGEALSWLPEIQK